MSHWAELDQNNKVLRVLVGDNNSPDQGYQWLIDNLGGTWIQTSINGSIRKQYAGVGYSYDADADVFIAPKPYSSWTLDNNFDWQPSTPRPDGVQWVWDENTLSWIELEA